MKKTYIVKYDLFPYYIVIKGEKMEFCGETRVMSSSIGNFSMKNILGEFGVEVYEDLKAEHRMLCRKYDEGLLQLKKDLLASSSISDIMQHKIQH